MVASADENNMSALREGAISMKPELDHWLSEPAMRVAHRRESAAAPERLWEAARTIRLEDSGMLGRLIRWRIPGLPEGTSFDDMFHRPPFIALVEDADGALTAGLVGRIWTLRRDYPQLDGPEEYERWDQSGTAKVLFANWIEPASAGRTALCSEVRVRPIGIQGRIGVAAVRPLVSAFQQLVGSEGIAAAVRLAERE
jgi:hypothetical protein